MTIYIYIHVDIYIYMCYVYSGTHISKSMAAPLPPDIANAMIDLVCPCRCPLPSPLSLRRMKFPHHKVLTASWGTLVGMTSLPRLSHLTPHLI